MPWIKDYYQTWIAQNKRRMIYSTLKDGVQILSGAVSFGRGNTNENDTALADIGSGVDNIINRGIDIYQHSIVPDGFIGTAEAGDTACFAGKKGVYTYCRSIKPEYIDILDNFFDVYGYATNRVKVPNRNVRPHWTYTKTVGCNIKGNLPQQYITQICRNYNNGITFWKNGSEVGNYSLDNRV